LSEHYLGQNAAINGQEHAYELGRMKDHDYYSRSAVELMAGHSSAFLTEILTRIFAHSSLNFIKTCHKTLNHFSMLLL